MAFAKAARFACTPPFRNPALIFFVVALPKAPTVPRLRMDAVARCRKRVRRAII
jgi:hypothetical protein